MLNAIINLHAALKVPCGRVTGNKVATIGGLKVAATCFILYSSDLVSFYSK